MWSIELNVAGYRFAHEVADLRRPSLRSLRSVRLGTRTMRGRILRLRHTHAV